MEMAVTQILTQKLTPTEKTHVGLSSSKLKTQVEIHFLVVSAASVTAAAMMSLDCILSILEFPFHLCGFAMAIISRGETAVDLTEFVVVRHLSVMTTVAKPPGFGY
jgi:hypothetical protein